MAKDTLLYLPAKIIEGAIGLATISLFTRFFSRSEYGGYNLAMTTVSIGSLFLLGWLFQAAYRYVNQYTGENLAVFYSTVFPVWLFISFAVLAPCALFLLMVPGFFSSLPTMFPWVCLIMFLTFSLTQLLFYLLNAARLTKMYLLLSVGSAALKLALASFFVLIARFGVLSTILAITITDALVSGLIILRLRIFTYISLRLFNRNVLKKFLTYGLPLVGVSLTLSLLNHSDKYLVKFILTADELGVYAANYSIASSVFSMLLLAVMRGVYPTILQSWKENNPLKTRELLAGGVRYFLILGTPALCGISILSKTISQILDFRYSDGYPVIIFVSAAMFFLGLAEYSNKAFELTSETKPILVNSLICFALNLVLNLVTLSVFGYKAAGVNTMAAYLLYFILAYFKGQKLLPWSLPKGSLVKIMFSTGLMALFLSLITGFWDLSVKSLILVVPSGVLIYFLALYFSGEIKNDLLPILEKIKGTA